MRGASVGGIPSSHSPICRLGTRLRRGILAQFARYAVVGAGNTILSFAAYWLLVEAGLWYAAASGLAFAIGAVNGYLGNRSWTFRGHGPRAVGLARYGVVQAGGLALNVGLVLSLADGLGIHHLLAQGVTVPMVTLATFTANRRWSFPAAVSAPREAPEAAAP